jgi:hypothetical protein
LVDDEFIQIVFVPVIVTIERSVPVNQKQFFLLFVVAILDLALEDQRVLPVSRRDDDAALLVRLDRVCRLICRPRERQIHPDEGGDHVTVTEPGEIGGNEGGLTVE